MTLSNLANSPDNEEFRQPTLLKKSYRDYLTMLDIFSILGFFNFDLGDENTI